MSRPDAKIRLFGVSQADYMAMNHRTSTAREAAIDQFEERFRAIFQRRHDCIHNCDRPRMSPQPLDKGGTVLKVIQDIEYLVHRCDEHINSEFREFLAGVGCSYAIVQARPTDAGNSPEDVGDGKETAMIDAMTGSPCTLQPMGQRGLISCCRFPNYEVRQLLDDHGIRYWVEEDVISLNGRPETAVIDLGRGADVDEAIEAVLDTARSFVEYRTCHGFGGQEIRTHRGFRTFRSNRRRLGRPGGSPGRV